MFKFLKSKKKRKNIIIKTAREKLSSKFCELNEYLEKYAYKMKHILLIDDDDTSNFITKTTLESYGFKEKITVYDSAEEALEYLRGLINKKGEIPDMIFLDIKMPYMNGFQFLDKCEYIFDIQKDCRIVILSSSTYSKDKEKAISKGLEYITKPLENKNLENYEI